MKIIVDVDTGVDDAWALFLLLSSQRREFNILGITCVNGNTNIENVCRNTLYVLETAKKKEVPVFSGASRPLIHFEAHLSPDSKSYYGANGFGDVELPEKSLPEVKEENAVVALNRLVQENRDEVTLICLAPLTNIALAVCTYPCFARNVKEIFVMGGNYTALGNTTMCAEFNFHTDPEAAHIVLTSFENKLTLLPWETCFNLKIPFEWRCDELNTSGSNNVIKLLNDVEESILTRGKKKGYKHWISCDTFLAISVENSSVVTKKFTTHACIELGGVHTRGQMVIDHLKTKANNITVIEAIDQGAIEERLLQMKQFYQTSPRDSTRKSTQSTC